MDRFEKYFKENRLRLDTEDLDLICWNNIEDSFKKYKRNSQVRRLYFAAGILLIVSMGAFLIRNKTQNVISEKLAIGSYAELSGLAKQETSFRQVIDIKVNEIKKQSIPVAYKSMFDGFVQQLKLIDQQYNLYLKEVEQHGYTNELVQQIIYNYQLKISVLQMLQNEMDKVNQLSKNEKNENNIIQLQI